MQTGRLRAYAADGNGKEITLGIPRVYSYPRRALSYNPCTLGTLS